MASVWNNALWVSKIGISFKWIQQPGQFEHVFAFADGDNRVADSKVIRGGWIEQHRAVGPLDGNDDQIKLTAYSRVLKCNADHARFLRQRILLDMDIRIVVRKS